MKPKTFTILFILLLLLASVTYFVFQIQPSSSRVSSLGEMPFRDLPLDRINEVHITRCEKGVTETIKLIKNDAAWVVGNRFDYPADFGAMLELVEKLRNAKVGRQFDASPDILSRLALHDPFEPDIFDNEKGVRIRILCEEENTLADVLLGKQRESSAINGGHYLKPTNRNTIYLVDQTFRLFGAHPREWIKSELLNMAPKNIETVTCLNPVDQTIIYEIKRPEKGAPPELQNVNDTEFIKNHMVESVFDTMSSFQIRDVAGKSSAIPEEITGFNLLPVFEFQLFDGTVYRFYTGKKAGDEYDGFYFKTDAPDQSPWVYIISEWVHQSLITDPEMFFEKTADHL